MGISFLILPIVAGKEADEMKGAKKKQRGGEKSRGKIA